MNILVAEDSIAHGVLYQEIFQTRGHQIRLAFDGEECVTEYSIKPNQYDIVILDYNMPKKNGIEVAREILTINPNQNICFVSSYGPELKSKLANLNFDERVQYVEKPFGVDEFVRKMEVFGRLSQKVSV